MSKELKRKNGNKKKKLSRNKKILISLGVVFFILMGILLGGYLYVKGKIFSGYKPSVTISDTKYSEVPGITNVLLVGTDARTLDENSRADSIIIATIDNNNKKIKLTSLFRDTLVNIPGYGENKINTAFALGGPELLIETIRDTYDINLDKYVIINFWGFEAIVDQIGGIELNVEDYMLEELNKYIGESTTGNDCPVTQAGIQVLNGKQALSYARIRKGVGDEYGRTERQREVLFKIAEKLKETKPSKYLGIMNNMLDYIKTNIDPLQALNMAYTIYKFPTLETEQLYIPVTELAEGRLYKNLGWVFLMDTEQNTKILKDFIYEDKMPNPDEYDYDHLEQVLADYAAEEGYYNNINDINPEDYIDETHQVLPEKQPVTNYEEEIINPPSKEETKPTIPDGSTTTPPSTGGETTPPPSDGGSTIIPPSTGGETTPPSTGGETTPPSGGSGTIPPENGGETTPPDNGSENPIPPVDDTTTPPVNGDGVISPEGGTNSNINT